MKHPLRTGGSAAKAALVARTLCNQIHSNQAPQAETIKKTNRQLSVSGPALRGQRPPHPSSHLLASHSSRPNQALARRRSSRRRRNSRQKPRSPPRSLPRRSSRHQGARPCHFSHSQALGKPPERHLSQASACPPSRASHSRSQVLARPPSKASHHSSRALVRLPSKVLALRRRASRHRSSSVARRRVSAARRSQGMERRRGILSSQGILSSRGIPLLVGRICHRPGRDAGD
jgi:hypothetical protein